MPRTFKIELLVTDKGPESDIVLRGRISSDDCRFSADRNVAGGEVSVKSSMECQGSADKPKKKATKKKAKSRRTK